MGLYGEFVFGGSHQWQQEQQQNTIKTIHNTEKNKGTAATVGDVGLESTLIPLFVLEHEAPPPPPPSAIISTTSHACFAFGIATIDWWI